jgi:hypothetical protein
MQSLFAIQQTLEAIDRAIKDERRKKRAADRQAVVRSLTPLSTRRSPTSAFETSGANDETL